MQLELYTQVLLWGFSLAVVLGAVAKKTNFCTMGGVSDWINFGDKNRLRLWILSMAMAASLMIFTSFDYLVFLQWMMPLSIDFTKYGASGQDLGSVIVGLAGLEAEPIVWLLAALVVGLGMLFWVMKAAEFRANRELLPAGLIVGLLVVMIWYLTAGSIGQALLEELDFMDQRPYAAGIGWSPKL